MENIVYQSHNALTILIKLVVIKAMMVIVDGSLKTIRKNQTVNYSKDVLTFQVKPKKTVNYIQKLVLLMVKIVWK